MKFAPAHFLISSPTLALCPPSLGLPEFAMVGRSNVGKSSFINALLARKGLAKTSNTPGKTRLINFYHVADALRLVDLPGYGYAKVSKTLQQEWQGHMEQYLLARPNMVLMLIDSRHPPKESDLQMLNWLQHHARPTQLILTKMDKLKAQEQRESLKIASDVLGLPPEAFIPFSAEKGLGVDVVRQRMVSWL